MKLSQVRGVFVTSVLIAAAGLTACGQILDLDAYSQSDSSSGSGGAGGMGSGGQAGNGGSMIECTPAMTASCYEGPADTAGVGQCKAGTKTCNADGVFGACTDQILPSIENCAIASDEDCNGASAGCTGIAYWSKAYGSADNLQYGSYVRALSDGSVVVLGEFSGAIDFGCETLTGSSGSTDIFLLRLDSSGMCAFVKQFGVPQYNDYAYGLAIDTNDNIILTGGYTRTGIDFGGGAFVHAGANDIYVAKLDKDGKHIWSKNFGDNGDQLAQSVNVDAADNVYLSGSFTGIIDLGNGLKLEAKSNERKGFFAKLDPAGNPLQADSFGVTITMTEDVADTKAAVDSKGNATVIGRFTGTFTSTAGMATSQPGGYDIFVLQYDSTGKATSLKTFGGASDDYNYHLATGPDGLTYITGRASGTPVKLTAFNHADLTIAGLGDIVLLKLNQTGLLQDARIFGNAGDQAPTGIAVDPLGHVLLGGNFTGEIDFGKGTLGTAMNSTVFLTKFDGSLSNLWSRVFYSSKPENSVRVGTDAKANILLTGLFNGSLQIKMNEPLSNAGNADIYAARLAP